MFGPNNSLEIPGIPQSWGCSWTTGHKRPSCFLGCFLAFWYAYAGWSGVGDGAGWGGVCHAIEFFLAPDGSLAFACYATEGSHALAHRLHALLPKVLLHLHIDYATLLKNLLHLHMDVMLHSEFFLALAAHGLHATLPKVLSRLHTDLMLCYRSFSCTWIQTSCDARVVFQKILSCQTCSPSP